MKLPLILSSHRRLTLRIFADVFHTIAEASSIIFDLRRQFFCRRENFWVRKAAKFYVKFKSITLNTGQVKVIISKYSSNLVRFTFSINIKLFLNIWKIVTQNVTSRRFLSEKVTHPRLLRILSVPRRMGNNLQTN